MQLHPGGSVLLSFAATTLLFFLSLLFRLFSTPNIAQRHRECSHYDLRQNKFRSTVLLQKNQKLGFEFGSAFIAIRVHNNTCLCKVKEE